MRNMENNDQQLNLKKFYDDLAQSWDNTRPKYNLKVFEKIISYLVKYDFSSVLDFGCGTGLFCKYVQENYPGIKVSGIDISSKMIEKARANCPGQKFYAGDIFSIPLPKYDAVVSKDVFNHIADVKKTLVRLDELVSPGGAIVIANREREQTARKEILAGFYSLKYQVSEEKFSFTPTDEEINSFLKTLSNFHDRHKAIIRKRLVESGDYYILYTRKS